MMTDIATLFVTTATGLFVGGLYFGLLWVSTYRLAGSGKIDPIVILAALTRWTVLFVALAGLTRAGLGTGAYVAWLAGFLTARLAATNWAAAPPKGRSR